MKIDKIPWFLSFILSISLIFLFFLVLLGGVRNRIDVSQPLQDVFLSLPVDKDITQSFTAKHDFINIIILNFKNPGLENQGQFRFFLLSEKGEPLVERVFSGYNLGDPSQVRFQFEPIPSSENKNYIFGVEVVSPSETPEIGIGAKKEGSLSFSVYYRAKDKKAVLVDFFRSTIGHILKDPLFFINWVLMLVILVAIGVRQARKSP